jgi:hypothetical protein
MEDRFMKKRWLIFLDFVDLTQRGGMDNIVYEFLELLVIAEIKAKKLPKKALKVIQEIKKKNSLI